MKTILSLATTAVLLGVASTSAHAQLDDSFREPGLWLQLGGGVMSVKADCPPCLAGRRAVLHGVLSGGGSLSSRFKLGVEAVAMYSSSVDTSSEFQALFAVVEVVPLPGLPITVRGGLGGGRYAQLVTADLTSATGLAFTLGIASELGITRRFQLIPYVRYIRGAGLPSKLNGLPQFTDTDLNMIYGGVAIGWR